MSWSEAHRHGRWLAVVAWATVILVLSTDWFGGEETGAVLLPLLRWLWPTASPEALNVLHGLVRKAAHVAEYAVFGALLLRALAPDDRPTGRRVGLAVAGGALLAALDESHQALVPGRTGSPGDVIIDTAGVLLGAALVALHGLRARETPAPAPLTQN